MPLPIMGKDYSALSTVMTGHTRNCDLTTVWPIHNILQPNGLENS